MLQSKMGFDCKCYIEPKSPLTSVKSNWLKQSIMQHVQIVHMNYDANGTIPPLALVVVKQNIQHNSVYIGSHYLLILLLIWILSIVYKTVHNFSTYGHYPLLNITLEISIHLWLHFTSQHVSSCYILCISPWFYKLSRWAVSNKLLVRSWLNT